MRVKGVKGRIFPRGNRWWIAYYEKTAGGKSLETREPGGATEKEARNKLKHRQKELGAHDLGVYSFTGPEAERITVGDLLISVLAQYESERRDLKKSVSHMKHLRAFFGGERAVQVNALRVQQYIAVRRRAKQRNGKPYADATIYRELHILQRAFSLAVQQKRLSAFHTPEFPALSEENTREGFAGKGDVDTILAHLKDGAVRDYVAWAFWTGMRRGEIKQLTWAAFDRETSALTLPKRSTKTKKPRKLVLEGVYREIIKRRLLDRVLGCELIFHRHGKPMGDFRKAWKSASKKAGVPELLFHDLRRTALRNLIRAGVDQTVAKKISGHKTDAVFERYNITSDEDLREAMQKQEAYVTALPVHPRQKTG
ncbi:MAG: site-specific integrase [Nitrospira sp.]|nr:site-specific integrase [Nitrospira sp.]